MNIISPVVNHPEKISVRKFENSSIDRTYIVKVDTPSNLSPLAQFLADNVKCTHRSRSTKVTCYSEPGLEKTLLVQKHGLKRAESICRMYGVTESTRSIIEDWDFSQLVASMSPSEYFEREATLMRAEGVKAVVVRTPWLKNKILTFDLEENSSYEGNFKKRDLHECENLFK